MQSIKKHPNYHLIKKEKWDIELIENERGIAEPRVIVYGQDFPMTHPFFIHGKLYRESENPEIRFKHLQAMHFQLWPDDLWHDWVEERYRAHCEGWKIITLAGGASKAKSRDSATLSILFWWSNVRQNTVIVASTTLKSLQGRIWGYVTSMLAEAHVPLDYRVYTGNNPHVLYDPQKIPGGKKPKKDTIHGMFAIAAKRGQTEEQIKDWIGRHPKYGLLIVLDECTDMPAPILGMIPNLETAPFFQMIGIGNSASEHDLHGALSTPVDGWDSLEFDRPEDIPPRWETQHDRGLCIYSNPYRSPAILDPCPDRRARLAKFLTTTEKIEKAKENYGEDSKSFWRFCMGYWKTGDSTETVISEKFIRELNVKRRAEWKGDRPVVGVAGLDVAFSTGGDKCILRLANIGYDIHNDLLMDFCGNGLLHYIDFNVNSKDSAEAQIAKQVVEILRIHGIPLNRLALDANGVGRAIGEVIKLTANSPVSPIKIYSTRQGTKKDAFDVEIRTPTEMWFAMRDYMQADMIRGLDEAAIQQLVTRRVIQNEKTLKNEIQSKRDYKSEMNAINPSMAHSPDEADAAVLCLQAAMMTAGFALKQKSDDVLKGNLDRSGDTGLNAILQERLRLHEQNLIASTQKTPPQPKMNFARPASLRRLKAR